MTPSAPKPALLHDFLEGRLDPAQFHHREHVRIGYELLEQHPFSEALFYLSAGLRLLAAKAGHPEVRETEPGPDAEGIPWPDLRTRGPAIAARTRSFHPAEIPRFSD